MTHFVFTSRLLFDIIFTEIYTFCFFIASVSVHKFLQPSSFGFYSIVFDGHPHYFISLAAAVSQSERAEYSH